MAEAAARGQQKQLAARKHTVTLQQYGEAGARRLKSHRGRSF